MSFHLAPTFLARPDPDSGRIHKLKFGPWMKTAFGWLARLRRLRGTPFDVFGYHAERKAERALTAQFEADIGQLIGELGAERLPIAIELARLPDEIRGYGHIKAAAMQRAAEKREALLARWRAGGHRPANVA